MGWVISRHAFARLVDMRVDRQKVIDIVADPETDYPSDQAGNCRVATRDGIAVVYDRDDHVIVTVLWHGREHERGRASPKTELRKIETAARQGR